MNILTDTEIIERNKHILDEIKQSGKTCCFDESLPVTHEGRIILRHLRVQLGSRRLFIEALVEDKISQREGSSIAMQFLKGLNVHPAAGPMHYLVTRDINLAEYIGRRTSETRVYILNNNGLLRSWKEERGENMARAINDVGNTLAGTCCWVSSSALASARICRFAEIMEQLPESSRAQLHLLDVSAGKASRKSSRAGEAIRKLTSLCSCQGVEAAFPSAHENTLLALVIIYAPRNASLITIWNSAEQAERVCDIVESYPEGKDRLRNVAFCELSWYGKLVPLKNFTRNNLVREILQAAPDETSTQSTKSPRPDLFALAVFLNKQIEPLRIKLMDLHENDIANPADTLSQEQINFLCSQFPLPEPDEQMLKTCGPQLGKMVAKLSLNEIQEAIGSNPQKRELAIIYARRWEKTDMLQALLNEAELLSPYCFNNWFKRSQNAERSMVLEDLLLNGTYYNLLQQVIEKTPYFARSEDAVSKLQLLQRSAIVAEVRKRASRILELIGPKGAAIPPLP